MQYEYTVNGKTVKFKERLTVKDAPRFYSLYRALTVRDPERFVPMACAVIESWEFDGAPSDPASYDNLDFVSVWEPLSKAVNEYTDAYVRELTAKNA